MASQNSFRNRRLQILVVLCCFGALFVPAAQAHDSNGGEPCHVGPVQVRQGKAHNVWHCHPRPKELANRLVHPLCSEATLEEGSGCWVRVDDHPDCHVWVLPKPYVVERHYSAWSGPCSDGVAHGRGQLNFMRARQEHDGKFNSTFAWTGEMVEGRRQGHWTYRFIHRLEFEGVPGHVTSSGLRVHPSPALTQVRLARGEGRFVHGREHGEWTGTWERDDVFGYDGTFTSRYEHGRLIRRGD